MKEFIFRAAVYDVQFDLGSEKSFSFDSGFHLYNDSATIYKYMTRSPFFLQMAGQIEFEDLLMQERGDHAKVGGVLIAEGSDQSLDRKHNLLVSHLNDFLGTSFLFLNTLWLIKDNSANLDRGYLEVSDAQDRRGLTSVTSNYIGAIITDSKGKRTNTTFTSDELQRTKSLFSRIHGDDLAGAGLTGTKNKLFTIKQRPKRILHLLQGVRKEDALPVKILQYITCLESLLSGEPKELAHQVAERCALLLRASENPIDIYHGIKAAYNIRSKIAHGAALTTKDLERCESLSVLCDRCLRSILNMIYSDSVIESAFSNSSETLNQFFLDLLLGNR